MMIGLEVAPVAPRARLRSTRSGSIESSHSLVPLAMSDCSGLAMSMPPNWGDLRNVSVRHCNSRQIVAK